MRIDNINYDMTTPYATILAFKICIGDIDDVDYMFAHVEDYDIEFEYEEYERVTIGNRIYRKRNTLLELACKYNYPTLAHHIEQYSNNINHVDSLGRNALFYAATNKLTDIADKLINRNIDINQSDIFGYTSLMVALLADNAYTVNKLMDYDINTRAINKYGETILHIACKCGYGDVCIKLYERSGENKYAKTLTNLNINEYIRIYSKIFRINKCDKYNSIVRFEQYIKS